MSLIHRTTQAFSNTGVLAQNAKAFGAPFQARAGQQEMAHIVAQTLQARSSAVIEAGTGVGKTFAYLVPVVLSGARAILSTATKTLQDQLFGRDLPAVIDMLGSPTKAALLKGRGSYLCLYRLQMHTQTAFMSDEKSSNMLALVTRWSATTQTGDLAELATLDERSPVIPLITSTRENCLASECAFYKNCHLMLARKEALNADIVVVNHHLFFADMAVRESGVAQILPSAEVVVFDEAHQINEIGVRFLAKTLSSAALLDFARDLLAAGLQHAKGLAQWDKATEALEYSTRDLRLATGKQSYGVRLPWTTSAPQGIEPQIWEEALTKLTLALNQAVQVLEVVEAIHPEFKRLQERALGLIALAEGFAQTGERESVRWLEVGSGLQMIESPLDIAQTVQQQWFGKEAMQRSWVFTSATLGSDDALSWFTQGAGLQALPQSTLRIARVQSPFDYGTQSALYVPRDFPTPREPHHGGAVAQVAWEAASLLDGRTLVLTTTLRALRQIGQILCKWSEDAAARGEASYHILMQGQAPKGELLAQFKARKQASILVASASFWEGVDIGGDALMCVVIDKLPFPPPDDPLVEARTQRFERAGRSSFNDYFIPEAAVALKQGTGRLIRRESDRGVLAVCDTRLTQARYGSRLMDALPQMPLLQSQSSWFAKLHELQRGLRTLLTDLNDDPFRPLP